MSPRTTFVRVVDVFVREIGLIAGGTVAVDGSRGGRMIWKVLVVTDDEQQDGLFVGSSRDRAEIEAVATEALKMRSDVVVWVTPPTGPVIRWEMHDR